MKEKLDVRLESSSIQMLEEQAKLLGLKKTALVRKIVENYLATMNLTKRS